MEYHTNKKDLPKQAAQVISIADDLFGEQILGIYLYGSATLGGLRPDSDIDILIMTSQNITDDVRGNLTKELLSLSGCVGHASKRPLEVTVINYSDIFPWKFPPRCDYMYGEWLRNEMEAGKIPQPCNDADITILLWQARAHGMLLRGKPAKDYIPFIPNSEVQKAIKSSLPELLATIKGDERNILLTLSRMWFTLETGEICPKDIAAEWVLPKLPNDLVPILRLAITGYLGKCADEWNDLENETLLLVNFLRAKLENIMKNSE